jgi:hypothetical protein
MTGDIAISSPSAEAIRDAFIADAVADAELVVRVSELLATFGELKERIEATHKDLMEAYAAAAGRPNAAKKLVELGLPRPDELGVDLGTAGRGTNGKRGAGGRRRARTATVGKEQADGQQEPEGDAMVVSAESAQAAEENSEVGSGSR